MPDDEPGTGHDPVEKLLDLCVYAPLGFVVDARRVLPELAERGRAQAGVARMVGEFAVTWGNTKLQGAVADAQEQAVDLLRRLGVAPPARDAVPAAEAGEATDDTGAEPGGAPEGELPDVGPSEATAAAREAAEGLAGPTSSAEAEALAIPEYDNLSASQVVPRLDGLTPEELEAVRRYERRHRHRKTILSRIAQLQSSAG